MKYLVWLLLLIFTFSTVALGKPLWNRLPKRRKAMIVGAGVAVVFAASSIWNHGKADADDNNFLTIVSTVLVLLLWGLYRLCALVLPRLPRIVIALAVSVVLHCMIGFATLYPSPSRLAVALLTPAALVMWLFYNHFPDSAFVIGLSLSLAFYTAVAWLILWAWPYLGWTSADKSP